MAKDLKSLKSEFQQGLIDKAEFIRRCHECFHSVLFEYAKELKNTGIDKIEITDDHVLMRSRIDQLVFDINSHDHRVAPIETINFGLYEPKETLVIRRLSANVRAMLDIGANIGWFSLMVAKMNPNANIFAFEPILMTFKELQQNCRINNISSIYCYNFGLGSSPGSFPFYYYHEGGVNASLRNLGNRDNTSLVMCDVKTVDMWVHDLDQCPTIDFIKCDVEGNELDVILGGKGLIKDQKPILLMELLRKWSAAFGYHPNEVIWELKEMGYETFIATSEGTMQEVLSITDETTETNFYFVHPESRLKNVLLNPSPQ